MSRRGFTVLLVLAVFAGAGWWTWRTMSSELHAPGPHDADVLFEVRSGATQRQVLKSLAEVGVIREARAAELALRAARHHAVFRAGRYRLPARASLLEIVARLESGQVELESLTIPEGWTFAEARAAIEAHTGVRATLRGRSEAELLAAAGQNGTVAEGRFFPDTYRFAAGTTDAALYRQGFARLQALLDAAWAARARDLPLADPDAALTLASIIEKETGAPDERALIAAVFHNRLRAGMRLQSDPTVIYGLGSAYDGNIRTRDLRTDTVYNTYTRKGLPPTPIALPGRGAIEAALRPADSDALYFVATGLGDGRHVFNRDYAAHQRAVTEMLRRQRAAALQGAP